MSLVVNPYSYFTDTNGNALNGYLYVGEVGKNAENYPIAIFYDALFTIPAPNPLTVSAGYIYNGGTIAQIYASVDYSIVVKKTDGSLVYSSLNETGMTNGAIANIDEMKDFVTPYNNYALNVLGYSEAGDGGGGTFYYDANSTEADNGGTIIEPTSGSGRWIRVDGAINVKWFGAVGDGVTDDTAAIQAALDGASATTYRDVILPAGNYLISDTLEIPEGVSLIGQGNRSAFSEGVEGQPSKITKKSTMTTVGVKLSGKRSRLQNLGVYCQTGATGDGIWIAANYCSLVNVSSNGHGGVGIRIGSTPAGYVNCNGWYLEQITAGFNTSHGVIIDDQFTAYPSSDANAGVFIGGDIRSNGDDGLFVGNCFANTFIGIETEQNVGYGMFFDNESVKHTILGGDQDEGNTVGVIYNNGLYNTFVGILSSNFTDVGSYTNMLGFTGTKLNHAIISGSATVSTACVAGAPSMVVLKNQSAEANGRGCAIEFQVPAGASTAPRTGAKLVARNTINSLYDSADLYLNVNGTLTGFAGWESYPTGRSYRPAVDNDVDLGYTSYRWKQLYAGTATINTSDERLKEQFAEITTAERNAALKVKAIIKSFKFKDAVAKKGDDARIHFGVSAQAVAEIFRSEGLDPERYSLFCFDQWGEQEEVIEDGQIIVPYRAAGNAYGIRYEELLAFIIASI